MSSALNQYHLPVLGAFIPVCEPCDAMNTTVSGLAGDLKVQVAFGDLNDRVNRKTIPQYNISYYPTILIFANGTLVDSEIGYWSDKGPTEIFKRVDPNLNTSLVDQTKWSISIQLVPAGAIHMEIAPTETASTGVTPTGTSEVQSWV